MGKIQMINKPVLSIIIPVYNANQYLDDCLRSIFMQGFKDDEFEVLCIDDGSTDSSVEIIRKWSKVHLNIRTFHQANAGVSAARNLGLSQVTGSYFQFVDADDVVVPGSLKIICDLMRELHCTVAQFNFKNGFEFKYVKPMDISKYYVDEMTLSGSVWRYIFSSAEFGNMTFDTELKYEEDTFFVQCVRLHRPRCLVVEDRCYFYRQSQRSAMATRDFSICAESMLRIATNLQKILHEGTFQNESQRIIKWSARATAGYIYYRLRAGFKDSPFQMLRNMGLWPYPKEWDLLRVRTESGGGKLTLSNWLLFLVGIRPIWFVINKINILSGR
ncbi:glycosyltransferase [Olsenella profusa]|uniref:Glycosyltransferase n=1 Tax=Olsenella profusa TaxID=138595 RepID=A0ABS2F1V1_9ACTN|nr:glycosyltransferase [Olsenella profusa]MBM6774920.1 glycosyltransferase [Olsenella profusa]